MSQTRFDSSEEENESEEGPYEEDQDYLEVPGEYDDEYDQNGEEDWEMQPPRHSKDHSRSTRSSLPGSVASGDKSHPMRKSLNRKIVGGLGYNISEDDPLNLENQHFLDSLPEDIYYDLLDFWQDIDNMYYPIHEKAFEGINKTHKKLLDYPAIFQLKFQEQLNEPDSRANVAEHFKSDFNRVPLSMRDSDHIKSALQKRVNEFIVNLEAVTEEKYASTKRNAYRILSKAELTKESEKMARLFAALLHAETNRFADTVKFINQHYYNTIAINLQMPNKVRWKEIMDIGLIKKKFLCEHFRNQCFNREQSDGDGDTWKYPVEYGFVAAGSSSSDSDVCGGGLRGQDFSLICEDEDDDSTPIEEDSDNSLFKNEGDNEENEGVYYGQKNAKMSGEMKLSLECDNEEYLGEDGWDMYAARQNVTPPSTGIVEVPELTEYQQDSEPENNLPVSPQSIPQSNANKPLAQPAPTKKEEGAGTGKVLGSTKSKSKKSKVDNTISKKSKSRMSIKKSSLERKASKKKQSSKTEQKLKNYESGAKYEEEENEEVGDSKFAPQEEYAEELEMEETAIVQNQEYYENEYAGEFWEGEGYDAASSFIISKGTGRDSSVKFDEKPPYIREFFYDSDPSKQDNVSKSEKGKEQECTDEGYFDDDEELFDDEDVFYNRDEFFEKEEESSQGSGKNKIRFTVEESQGLHFGIFGREADVYSKHMSLLDKLLLRWNGQEMGVKGASNVTEMNTTYETEQVKGDEEGLNEELSASNKHETRNLILVDKLDSDDMKNLSPSVSASNVKSQEEVIMSGGMANKMLMFPLILTGDDSIKAQRTGIRSTAEMLQQKRPLLECFVNLHDEVWNGFEIAFRDARSNIKKLTTSLKAVVSRAYPIEDPRDPCEPEVDLQELIVKGEAIKEKYKAGPSPRRRSSKPQKHVHLKGSIFGDENAEIPGEGQYYSSTEDEEDEEEGNFDAGSPKPSFIELVPLQPGKNGEFETLEAAPQNSEKRSSVTDSKNSAKKDEPPPPDSSNKKDAGSLKKKSAVVPDSSSGTKYPDKISQEQEGAEGSEGITDEDRENQSKRISMFDPTNTGEGEKESSLNELQSPHSDKTELVGRKSAFLERSRADTDIRLPDSPLEPTPEEKKMLKRAKHALLITKLQSWEQTLELEVKRLTWKLALIELHAQHEFRTLKELPLNIWENSKNAASDGYLDDLKRDAEIGEMFKSAVQDGSPLHGKFYVDRHDLWLLLKGDDPSIPLKYFSDEFFNEAAGKTPTNGDYGEMEE